MALNALTFGAGVQGGYRSAAGGPLEGARGAPLRLRAMPGIVPGSEKRIQETLGLALRASGEGCRV